jgi:methionine synthase II (cobalamin-independent)
MICMLVDPDFLEAQKKEGYSLDSILDPAIKAHNFVARDLPSDLTLAVHLCRGNQPKGLLAAVGGFDQMAPKVCIDE